MTCVVHLIPSPLHDEGFSFLTPSQVEVLNGIRFFIVESARQARRNLRKMGFTVSFEEVKMVEWSEHTRGNSPVLLKEWAGEQSGIGLMSDAGMPCVADPGYEVVYEAHRLGWSVNPWVGPNSILMTLMASGLNGQQFHFWGYVPKEREQRKSNILLMDKQAQQGTTCLFMDTPYRNDHLLEDLLQQLPEQRMLCIGSQVHSPAQKITTKSVAQWRKNKPTLGKVPVMFAIGR